MSVSKKSIGNKIKRSHTILATIVISLIAFTITFLLYFVSLFIINLDAWPTYTDRQNHFSIEYPPGWTKKPDAFVDKHNGKVVNVIVLTTVNQSIDTLYKYEVNLFANDDNHQLTESRDKVEGKDVIKLFRSEKFADNEIYKDYTILIDFDENKTLYLSGGENDKEAMDYMISTLKINK